MAATTEEETVDAVSELLISKLPWVREYSASDNPNANLDIREIALVLIDSGHIAVVPPGVETVHWFPDDLVEWPHQDAHGEKLVSFGVVRMIERVPGKATLWVSEPGRTEPKPWPADECRLLRRINKNKEGQQ